jgi:hypothetical protein
MDQFRFEMKNKALIPTVSGNVDRVLKNVSQRETE